MRVDVNPTLLNNFGLGLEDVRTVLGECERQSAQGAVSAMNMTQPGRSVPTDQLLEAAQYPTSGVAYHNGAPVRLGDVATVTDSVEDLRNSGYANRKPSDADDHLPPAAARTSSRRWTAS